MAGKALISAVTADSLDFTAKNKTISENRSRSSTPAPANSGTTLRFDTSVRNSQRSTCSVSHSPNVGSIKTAIRNQRGEGKNLNREI
jgi:cytochrome c peroxidase